MYEPWMEDRAGAQSRTQIHRITGYAIIGASRKPVYGSGVLVLAMQIMGCLS